MTEQFVIEVRRVEIQKKQYEEALWTNRRELRATAETRIAELNRMLLDLKAKFGAEIPEDQNETALVKEKERLTKRIANF